MARENSCLSRIAAVGGALGGVVGKLFSPFHFLFPLWKTLIYLKSCVYISQVMFLELTRRLYSR